MIFPRKNRFKPLYKQLIKLRENVQSRRKLFNFKKQKWDQFIKFAARKLKVWSRSKPISQTKSVVPRSMNKWNSYRSGKYRNTLYAYKKFKTMYGGFTKKKIKKVLNISLNKSRVSCENAKLILLRRLESRLDTVLYRAKFCTSIRSARQIITHGKTVLVNHNKVKSPSYILKPGDLISVDFKHCNWIEASISIAAAWPIPPKYLTVNYKTLQIIFGTSYGDNVSTNYTFHLNLKQLLVNFMKH